MKESEMRKVLQYIMADFDAVPSVEKVAVWYDQCKHLDPAFAMEAAKVLMRGEFYGIPKVSEFLRVVDEMTKPAGDKMTKVEAWALAYDAARRYGAAQSGRAFLELREHPRVVDTIRAIGWNLICTADVHRDLPFVEKRFQEQYEAAGERAQTERQVNGVLGLPPAGAVRELVGGVVAALPEPKKGGA